MQFLLFSTMLPLSLNLYMIPDNLPLVALYLSTSLPIYPGYGCSFQKIRFLCWFKQFYPVLLVDNIIPIVEKQLFLKYTIYLYLHSFFRRKAYK